MSESVVMAVSYTHLDMARMNNAVETQGQEPKAVADAFLAEKGPVSYTHLDVYKRQTRYAY